MVTSKKTLDIIKKIIEEHYQALSIAVLGKELINTQVIENLKAKGYDVSNERSIITAIYHHNFINNPRNSKSPDSLIGMLSQQDLPGILPIGQANDFSIENLNDKFLQLIEKMKVDVGTRVESIIRENNEAYKFDALKNLNRDPIADQMVKESSLGKVKQLLRDSSKDANRDWERVALTEMSNAIGAGSVDRIVTDNKENDINEVYVYRVPVNDTVTCKYCRKFYGDAGEIPKLYKLSSLLGNGSNYGKKASDWKPVTGATHPNTRTSQILELKPGYKLTGGGRVTYMGLENWKDWIVEHLEY